MWFWVWGIAYRFENTNENLSKNELNEILAPVEGNVSLIKKSDFWDRFTIGLFGFCFASGFVCAFSVCKKREDFFKPKIVYPNMTKYLPFVYDNSNYLTNQKCFIITGTSIEFLTVFFNSS